MGRGRLPVHVGIIMDGNGRWALARGLPRSAGHVEGAKVLRKVVGWCLDRGIRYVSFYAFSTENWRRPPEEVSAILGLLRNYLLGEVEELARRGGRMRFCGRREGLPADLLSLIDRAQSISPRGEPRVDVIICFNYGGRAEIVDAVNRLIESGKTRVSEEDISRNLYLPDVPDPDLIIRTSGEMRLSNFLLWQSAYSELFFVESYWPDFSESDFERALESFSGRERRFGGVSS